MVFTSVSLFSSFYFFRLCSAYISIQIVYSSIHSREWELKKKKRRNKQERKRIQLNILFDDGFSMRFTSSHWIGIISRFFFVHISIDSSDFIYFNIQYVLIKRREKKPFKYSVKDGEQNRLHLPFEKKIKIKHTKRFIDFEYNENRRKKGIKEKQVKSYPYPFRMRFGSFHAINIRICTR